MYGLYHTFNFLTGYKHVNPTVRAIGWRLIVLESVAGVPGFVAAGDYLDLETIPRYINKFFMTPTFLRLCSELGTLFKRCRIQTFPFTSDIRKRPWMDRYFA